MRNQFLLTLLILLLVGFISARALSKDSWKDKLRVADGYQLSQFATSVNGARLMVSTSKGDIIVTQTSSGIVRLLLADKDGDKKSDGQIILLRGLLRPHGLEIDGKWLYVALEDKVVRYAFDPNLRKITSKAEVLIKGIPRGGHYTRTIRKGPDNWFYVSIGSSCNVCMENHPWRASLIRFKPGEETEIYATGLRNTVGYDWQEGTNALYSVDNGRDWLGDELPPGEVNKIERGGFYGWPYFYGRNIADPVWGKKYDPKKHGAKIGTAHDMRAHVAPLSLKFLKHQKSRLNNGAALVTQHGSWNRSTPIGYKVIKLNFGEDGAITQSDFLTGFLHRNRPIGRPVDTIESPDGTIYISDDLSGTIWQMVPQ